MSTPRTDTKGLAGAGVRRRREYALRSLDGGGYLLAWPSKEAVAAGEEPAETGKPAKCLRWATRVAARAESIQRLGNKRAGQWAVEPVEALPEKVDRPSPVLLWDDPMPCLERIAALHQRYCERAEAWLRQAGVPQGRLELNGPPRALVTSRPQKWCGLYTSRDHTCHYVLGYAMMALRTSDHDQGGPVGTKEECYRTTVAHEVCHAYQRAFTGRRGGHAPDFFALMELAMREPCPEGFGERHAYNSDDCREASRKLSRWVGEAAESGWLAGLELSVTSERVERHGLFRGCYGSYDSGDGTR